MKFSAIFTLIVVILACIHRGTGRKNLRTNTRSTTSKSKISSNLLNIVKTGVRRGLEECQRLFKNQIWDCSFYNKNVTRKLPDFMQTTLPYANRETGFLHAITTAAIIHEITLQCTQNKIPGCSCVEVKNKEIKGSKRQWMWGGCSDNIDYGENATRNFLKSLKQRNSERQDVDFHNNEVGMRVVTLSVRRECKCIGVSGGCSVRVCWKSLSPFASVAASLKKKYHQAVQVTLSNNEVQEQSNRRGLKLVYLDSSPDYCVRNKTAGSSGLLGRTCANEEQPTSKCRALCNKCKLRPQTEQRTKQLKCRCKFVWCCRVECETCTKKYSVTTCTRR